MAFELTNQLHAAPGHLVTICIHASDIATGGESIKQVLTMEDAIDAILSEYSFKDKFEDFNLSLEVNPAFTSFNLVPLPIPSFPAPPSEPHFTTPAPQTASASSSSRFAALKTDGKVEQAKASSIPANTKKNTGWAINVWREWSAHRRQVTSSITEWLVHLFIARPQELNYWFSKFVLEARKENGEPYPPDTLYSICAGLLRYAWERRPEINIFKDHQYAGFQKTLDGEMKRLRSLGLGVKKRQADPITIQKENDLWEKGILGEHDPQTLLDTLLFLCGIHFALWSGQEHRNLQLSQFEIQSDQEVLSV